MTMRWMAWRSRRLRPMLNPGPRVRGILLPSRSGSPTVTLSGSEGRTEVEREARGFILELLGRIAYTTRSCQSAGHQSAALTRLPRPQGAIVEGWHPASNPEHSQTLHRRFSTGSGQEGPPGGGAGVEEDGRWRKWIRSRFQEKEEGGDGLLLERPTDDEIQAELRRMELEAESGEVAEEAESGPAESWRPARILRTGAGGEEAAAAVPSEGRGWRAQGRQREEGDGGRVPVQMPWDDVDEDDEGDVDDEGRPYNAGGGGPGPYYYDEEEEEEDDEDWDEGDGEGPSDAALRAIGEGADLDEVEATGGLYKYREDRLFYPGQSYELQDVDLSAEPSPETPMPPTRGRERAFTQREALEKADFRNVRFLLGFVSDTAKIRPKRHTKLTAKAQRKVAREIRTARVMGLMPFTNLGEPPFRVVRPE